eukprot:180056-Lingulodinium_polyedra.AAC.1
MLTTVARGRVSKCFWKKQGSGPAFAMGSPEHSMRSSAVSILRSDHSVEPRAVMILPWHVKQG